MRVSHLTCVAVLAAAACVSGPPQERGQAARAREVVVDLIEADNRCDLDTAMACYTQDAVWYTPDGDVVKGRARIADRYAVLYRDFEPRLTVICDSSLTGRDTATVRGTTAGELVSRDGSGTRRVRDRFIADLRCDRRGVWRIERLEWQPEK